MWVSFSMMAMSMPRASKSWLAICANRPKPMMSTVPLRPSAASTSCMSGGGSAGISQRSDSTASGVSAIERMTTAVSTALTCACTMPAAAAAANSTKANSPPCAINMVRCSASACPALAPRATAYTPAPLTTMQASTPPSSTGQSCSTSCRSSDMPTLMKNRPSRMPRNGSTSASSWWRKVDSDNITPAANAPMAIDKPPHCMASAAPSTTSSAAAVMTSRALARASRLNSGFSSQRLTATNPTTADNPTPTVTQRDTAISAGAGDRKATMASSGTMARSSSNKIDTMRWPRGVEVSPLSSSNCITMAVDDSTNPEAATKATAPDSPASTPAAMSRAMHTTTCARPSPKICLRRFHSRDGCISSPMTNKNITTPSSATCKMVCASLKNPIPKGPMARPAAR